MKFTEKKKQQPTISFVYNVFVGRYYTKNNNMYSYLHEKPIIKGEKLETSLTNANLPSATEIKDYLVL